MTKDKALKMARTALGVQLDALLGKAGHLRNDDRRRYAENGIKTIDEALAQPEQEPCGGCKGSGWVPRDPDIGTDQECFVCGGSGAYPKEPEQQPIAWRWGAPKLKNGEFEWRYSLNQTRPDAIPLYTTPPQRKPLSDEEIYKASTEARMQEHYMGFHSGFIRFARAIEAAHGIKGEV